jgi:hypothetical protein
MDTRHESETVCGCKLYTNSYHDLNALHQWNWGRGRRCEYGRGIGRCLAMGMAFARFNGIFPIRKETRDQPSRSFHVLGTQVLALPLPRRILIQTPLNLLQPHQIIDFSIECLFIALVSKQTDFHNLPHGSFCFFRSQRDDRTILTLAQKYIWFCQFIICSRHWCLGGHGQSVCL